MSTIVIRGDNNLSIVDTDTLSLDRIERQVTFIVQGEKGISQVGVDEVTEITIHYANGYIEKVN